MLTPNISDFQKFATPKICWLPNFVDPQQIFDPQICWPSKNVDILSDGLVVIPLIFFICILKILWLYIIKTKYFYNNEHTKSSTILGQSLVC